MVVAPRLGRWTRDHGWPELPWVIELGTDAAPSRDRFGFWCDRAFYEFSADPLANEAASAFSAADLAALYRDIVRLRSAICERIKGWHPLEAVNP
jgi:hypothetical protein